jgi:hypothetical protein
MVDRCMLRILQLVVSSDCSQHKRRDASHELLFLTNEHRDGTTGLSTT